MQTFRPTPALVVLLVAVVVGAGVAGWRMFGGGPAPEPPPAADDDLAVAPDPPPPDPRDSFHTAFRNTRAGVGYVGDKNCAGCHQAIAAQYRTHPMGRSAEWVGGGASPVERYDAGAQNPCRAGPFELFVDRGPDRVVHRTRAPVGEYAVAADLAIGSGTRGRSYLTIDHGAVWQSPVSWFSPAGGHWDLSPGYDLAGNGGRRAVGPACLFCHVDRAEAVAGALNRYTVPVVAAEPAIGCERCHGPGAAHAAERAAGRGAAAPDLTIVNPKHLAPALRGAVCEQCHLQGEARVARRGRDLSEFRPGLPLEMFVTVLVRHPDLADGLHSVGQVEQMEKSRCFTGSGGALGCVSCHDPHAVPAPAAKDAFYRGRCQTCHDTRPCTAPPADRAARADSCVGCHMPRADSASIVHASVTNHAVPRRPTTPVPPRGIAPGTDPMVAFRTGPHAAAGPEADRAVAIGLADGLAAAPPAARPGLAADAADRLAAVLKVWPGDAPSRVARASALGTAGMTAGRLAEARAAVRLAPASEGALMQQVAALTAAGRFDQADAAATAWVRLSPTAIDPLLARGSARAGRRDWAGAEADARAALALNPIHPRPRLLLAAARHRQGDPAAARREADAALALIARPDARQAATQHYLWMIGQ